VDATPGARVGRAVTASTADDGRSLKDAARILGISPHTVRVLARQRRIAHYRMGRRLVFKATDLAAYLAAHRVQARLSAELQ
jgi:excisionase family DNA binding protein